MIVLFGMSSSVLPFVFQAPYSDLESAYFSVKTLNQFSQGGAIGTPEKEVYVFINLV